MYFVSYLSVDAVAVLSLSDLTESFIFVKITSFFVVWCRHCTDLKQRIETSSSPVTAMKHIKIIVLNQKLQL